MLYREAGQYKTNYATDVAVFPLREDRIGLAVILILAFVVVGLGQFSLGLTGVSEVEPPGRVALWLYCDDVDAEIAALREAGVEIVKEPADTEWGERMATVADPDGNEIYIGQRAPH